MIWTTVCPRCNCRTEPRSVVFGLCLYRWHQPDGDYRSVTAANTNVLGYSPANRLSVANGPWGNGSIDYDGVGNRINLDTTLGGTPPACRTMRPIPTSNTMSTPMAHSTVITTMMVPETSLLTFAPANGWTILITSETA